MKALSAMLCSCCLSGAGMIQGAELSGTYVNKKLPHYRIEFLSDGGCFFSDALGGSSGRYTKENDAFVCRREEEVARFRIEGGGLIDQDNGEWVRREEIASMPWKDVRPVTMVVQDNKTRKPITEFSYIYQIRTATAKYDPLLVRPVEVRSAGGEFVLTAPEVCQIKMEVKGGNILGGFGSWKSYDLTADNTLRRIEVLVETGVTVTGTVVDARTGKPIAGASVSPMIFTPPLVSPDRERAVETDATGKFTIQGVDPDQGVNVWHPEYLEFGRMGFEGIGEKVGESLYSTQIRLEAGERLTGVVKDPTGKPLAGVEICDGAGKSCQTDSDGSFVLASPAKWESGGTYYLSFEKKGYLDEELHPKSAEPNGFSIVLQSVPAGRGQVLDPQGQPVDAYLVAAGMGPAPRRWRCSSEEVHDSEGRFCVPVRTDRDYDQTGTVWIGVRSPGFAFWDTIVPIGDLSRPVTARLESGVTVRGSIIRPKGRAAKISATLLPMCGHKEDFSTASASRNIDTETPVLVSPGQPLRLMPSDANHRIYHGGSGFVHNDTVDFARVTLLTSRGLGQANSVNRECDASDPHDRQAIITHGFSPSS